MIIIFFFSIWCQSKDMQYLMRSNTALNWIQLKVGGRNLETHNLETYQECNCSSCCNWSFQCRLKLFGKQKICHLDSYLYHKMVGIALTRLELRFNAKTGSLRNEVKLSKVIWKVCVPSNSFTAWQIKKLDFYHKIFSDYSFYQSTKFIRYLAWNDIQVYFLSL